MPTGKPPTAGDHGTAARQAELALIWHAEFFEVGEVLGPSGRGLVLDQLVATEERHLQVVDNMDDTPLPCLRETHRGDRGQQIDPTGRKSDLNDAVGFLQVRDLDPDLLDRCAEGGERLPEAPDVLRSRVRPDGQVARGSWDSVYRQGMRAHDQEANSVLSQFAQEVEEVLVQRVVSRSMDLVTTRTGVS